MAWTLAANKLHVRSINTVSFISMRLLRMPHSFRYSELHMKRTSSTQRLVASLALLICLALTSPAPSRAQAPVSLKNFIGVVDLTTTPATCLLEGQASQLGRFMARGELTFRAGDQPGSLVGVGPVVFRAANGDLLVGNMTWTLSAAAPDNSRTGRIQIPWSESVTFSNGVVVKNTGRFVTNRPPGANDGIKALTSATTMTAQDTGSKRR
jgi:hypothetical protein